MIIDFLLDDIRKAIAGLEDEVSGLTAESFASVDYVSSAKTIYFYNAVDEEVGSIDTTDFVVDGMIDTVSISGNVLHFVFNTDAGKQPIDVDLSSVMPDLSAYWTSAETKTYVDSAFTIAEDHITDVERVTASAYTELHDDILELSARTGPDMSLYTPTSGFSTINGSAITNGGNIVISADLTNYWTSAQTQTAISAATQDMVTSSYVSTIWRGTQLEYDAITVKDPNTFYIIVSS